MPREQRKEQRTFEAVRHEYTPEEFAEVSATLGRENQVLFDLKNQRTAVMKEYAARIDEAMGRVFDYTNRVNNRYEVRQVEVFYLLDDPLPGQKKVIRKDTNTELRTEAMTVSESQRSFGFQDPEADNR